MLSLNITSRNYNLYLTNTYTHTHTCLTPTWFPAARVVTVGRVTAFNARRDETAHMASRVHIGTCLK